MSDKSKRTLPPEVKVVFIGPGEGGGNAKPEPFGDVAFSTEWLFRYVFGDKKYYHSADRFNNPKEFRKEFKKLIKKLLKDIDLLQASELFIRSAKHDLERLESALLQGELTKEKQHIAVRAIYPIATFLGYGIGSKHKTVEPYFIPSFWSEIQGWNRPSEFYEHAERLRVDYRVQIAEQLSAQGLTHAEIAEVMNQTGYRIAQWLSIAKKKKGGKK